MKQDVNPKLSPRANAKHIAPSSLHFAGRKEYDERRYLHSMGLGEFFLMTLRVVGALVAAGFIRKPSASARAKRDA